MPAIMLAREPVLRAGINHEIEGFSQVLQLAK